MNIIIVAEPFTVEGVSFSTSGAQTRHEYHDPMDAVRKVVGIWDSPYMMQSVSEQAIRNSAWDQQEFMSLIKENCKCNVYIQPAYSDSFNICFSSAEDGAVFQRKMSENGIWCHFPVNLKEVITKWVETVGSPEHRVSTSMSQYGIAFRDPYYRTLARVKFTNTTPEDHHNLMNQIAASATESLDDVPF